MKQILITGVNSYIGKYTAQYLEAYKDTEYGVYMISQRDAGWEKTDFSKYDTLLHVTGIAHVDEEKITEEQEKQYFDINYRLAVRTAKKAKREGIRQFIFCSSILVYGGEYTLKNGLQIHKNMQPAPTNIYGESKWQAEQALMNLEDENFKVVILRIPFVYGPGSKGNYVLLSKWAGKLPIFTTILGAKSVIYIENLSECIRLLIEQENRGIFFPQNRTYASSAEFVAQIRKAHGKKLCQCSFLNPFVRLAACLPGRIGKVFRKVFGTVIYDIDMSKAPGNYQVVGFEESIFRSERKVIS